MPSYVTPKRATAYITYIGLVDQADTKKLKANPTIDAGDFKVSIDGGAFANLATLPTVTPASGTAVKISLSSGEMTGDNIIVTAIDAAGAEWCDQLLNIATSARQIDDLSYPATSGRSTDVDASGAVLAQAALRANVALPDFGFTMTDNTNHNPITTSPTVTATRAIDGGAYAACTNAPVERSAGTGNYVIDFSSTDMGGRSVSVLFTAAGCDPLEIQFILAA